MRLVTSLAAIAALALASNAQAKPGKPVARVAAPPAAIFRDCANRIDPKPGSFSPLVMYAPKNVQVSPTVFLCLAAPATPDDGNPDTVDARYKQYVIATLFSKKGHPLSQAVIDNRCLTGTQRKLDECKATRTLAAFTAAELCKKGRPFECVAADYGMPTRARVRWEFMTSTTSRLDDGLVEIDVVPY
jgi:hypothetical protein